MEKQVPKQWDPSVVTARVATTHLERQILPHLLRRCRCRTEDVCRQKAIKATQFAAEIMRSRGGRPF